MKIRRRMAVLTALIMTMLLCIPGTYAETVEDLPVISGAPLTRSTVIQDGMVRVYLSSMGSPTELDITVTGQYSVEGNVSMYLSDGDQVAVTFNSATGDITMTVDGISYAMGQEMRLCRRQASGESALSIAQAKRPSNYYPGDLQLLAQSSGSGYRLYPIVHVYLEYYLYGVVPYEMSSSWPIEALKAQAVAARTYTLRRMNARSSYTYDLVDTASDQVYYGYTGNSSNATRAVDATKGIVITNNGSLSGTYYTASNGGQTEAVKNAWGSSGYGYLGVKDDPFDAMNPNSNRRRLTIYSDFDHASQDAELSVLLTEAIQAEFGASASIVSIDSVTPHTPKYASPSRLYTMLDFGVTAKVGTAYADATLSFSIFDDLETQLGLSINSTKNELWSVEKNDEGFRLTIGRWGHGIGMSQRGAQQMANLGYTYDQILGFYYDGCTRVQYTFTHTILPSVGSGQIVTTEAPATISPGSDTQAMVSLIGVNDVVALRYTASEDGKVLTGVPNGSYLTVLARGNAWTLVQYGAVNGYLPTDSLTFTGNPPASSYLSPTNITQWAVNTGSSSLNFRTGPGYDYDVQGQIPLNAVLVVLSNSGSWAQVQYGQQTGYCATSFLTFHSSYPGETSETDPYASVSLPGGSGSAPLRSTASTTGTVIMNVPHGTQVDILSNDGSWAQVSIGGVTGYMLASQLDIGQTGTVPTNAPIPDALYAVVDTTSGSLNLRGGPGTNYTVLTEIPKGTVILVTSYGETWCAVQWGDWSGYVMTSYLSFSVQETPESSQSPTPTPTPTPSPTPTADSGAAGSIAYTITATGIYDQAYDTDSLTLIIPEGEQVTVKVYGADWCYVSYYSMTGWMQTSALHIIHVDAPTSSAPTATPPPTPTPSPTPVPTAEPSPDAGLADEQVTGAPVGEDDLRIAWVASTVTAINLRKTAAEDAEILASLNAGTELKVIEEGPTWSHVRYEDESGYVFTRYLSWVEPGEALGILYINTEKDPLALRSKPTTSGSAVLTRIERGEAVTLLEDLGDWCYVQYGRYNGYCSATYLSREKPSAYISDDTPLYDVTLESVTGWEAVTATSDGSSLYIREWCSTHAPAIIEVQDKTAVTLLQKGNIWCKISYKGETGYCLTSELTLTPPAE